MVILTQFTGLIKLSLKMFDLLFLTVDEFYVIARFWIDSVNFLKFLPYYVALILNFMLVGLYFADLGAQSGLLDLWFVYVFLNGLLLIVDFRLELNFHYA